MNDNNSIFCDFCNKKIDISNLITNSEKISIDYLQELLQEYRIVSNLSQFISSNIKKLLEREIMVSRHVLFHEKYVIKQDNKTSELLKSESSKNNVIITEKVFIPVHLNPTYNFIGRILGPGGLTLKQIEREFDCKIKIRGKGSVRNLSKENSFGKMNNSNYQDELHVIITVTGEESMARNKIKTAENYIKLLFDEAVSKSIDEDEAKQNQLMEYAIVKGTYRDMSFKHNKRQSKMTSSDFPANNCKRQLFHSHQHFPGTSFQSPVSPISPVIFYNPLSPTLPPPSILPTFGYPCKLLDCIFTSK